MSSLHEFPRHDALPHFDLSFQSRTADVCLTAPCRTKTSYHSLQELQGASALIHVCLHIWAAKTATTALLACCRLCVFPEDMAILGLARGSLIIECLGAWAVDKLHFVVLLVAFNVFVQY
jgi:hypothetical protein